MTRSIKIVKIGGNVINNPSKLKEFLKAFAALEGPKILVHGGGREATTLASRFAHTYSGAVCHSQSSHHA